MKIYPKTFPQLRLYSDPACETEVVRFRYADGNVKSPELESPIETTYTDLSEVVRMLKDYVKVIENLDKPPASPVTDKPHMSHMEVCPPGSQSEGCFTWEFEIGNFKTELKWNPADDSIVVKERAEFSVTYAGFVYFVNEHDRYMQNITLIKNGS